MKSTGKIIGAIFVGLAAIGLVAFIVWLVSESANTRGGAALGLLLAIVVLAPLGGVGIYLYIHGAREERAMAEVQEQRKLLNIVQTRGQVTVSDLVLELDADYSEVKNWIYDLVGKGIFSGYINWEEGILYSQQASQLRGETRCKHCGGEIKLVGKGVVSCPYCGTEYFLS